MFAASQVLAAVAVLSVGVIYGTDIFSAVVFRPAMAALADPELTQAAGRIQSTAISACPYPAPQVPPRPRPQPSAPGSPVIPAQPSPPARHSPRCSSGSACTCESPPPSTAE
jgi:hypothetical protein